MLALRLFSRVAALGSFSLAATEFHLPASSVSRHIAALENALGQRLLYRHTRAVRLTDAGQRYFEQVREALAQLELAAEQIDGEAGQPTGVLRLNAPVAFGRLQLMPLLSAFQQRYPGIEVELMLTDAVIDPVQEGVDVTFRIGRLLDSSLVARSLGEQINVLCAAPQYLAEHGTPYHPSDLAAHHCLVYKGARGVKPWYLRPPGERAFKPFAVQGRLRSNSAECLVDAALRGEGIILFPTWLLAAPLRSGQLVPILADWQASEDPQPPGIHVIYPENRLRSTKVRLFLEDLFARVGSPPIWDDWRNG